MGEIKPLIAGPRHGPNVVADMKIAMARPRDSGFLYISAKVLHRPD